MTQKENGGSAFSGRWYHPDGTILNQWAGMSLRDWFAGQALNGLMTNREWLAGVSWQVENVRDALCEEAYRTADAMLSARNAK